MTRLVSCLVLLALTLSPVACGPAVKGGQAMRAGEYKAAVGLFQEALADNPGDRWTRRQLGRAYLFDGQYDLAGIELGSLVAIQPDDWESTFYLALAHIGQGRREQGYQELRELVIPFAYYMKVELVRAAERFAAQGGLPAAEVIAGMDDALATAKQNQDRREAGDKNN
jgi:tetratricopeptide (TPR) repeat protein